MSVHCSSVCRSVTRFSSTTEILLKRHRITGKIEICKNHIFVWTNLLVAYMRLSHCQLVSPQVGPLVSHAVEYFAKKLSKLHQCPCPPVRHWCCRVYSLVLVWFSLVTFDPPVEGSQVVKDPRRLILVHRFVNAMTKIFNGLPSTNHLTNPICSM